VLNPARQAAAGVWQLTPAGLQGWLTQKLVRATQGL
jgi:hypothetical protein